MKFVWKKIEKEEYITIEKWLSSADRHNLCMEKKSWKQTAEDIEDCLNFMDNSEFRNVMGYIGETPVIAIMLGIENEELLNIYNILVSPKYRHLGVGKNAITDIINNNALLLDKNFSKIKVSVVPENDKVKNFFSNLGFNASGFDGDYDVFYKQIFRENIKSKEL